jgi:14-3-3 protein epsilon
MFIPSLQIHRYLAEFKAGAERKEAAENTLVAYKSAQVSFVERLIIFSSVLLSSFYLE